MQYLAAGSAIKWGNGTLCVTGRQPKTESANADNFPHFTITVIITVNPLQANKKKLKN